MKIGMIEGSGALPVAQVPPEVKALSLPLLPMAWIVRTRGPQGSLPTIVAEKLENAGRGLPVARVRTMDQVLGDSITSERVYADLMAGFAGISLLLVGLGVYGLLRFAVEQRIPEIGVRLALGASRADIFWNIARRGVVLIAVGSVLGLGLAFGLTRFLESLLFGVTSKDPLIFAAAPVILASVALLALASPAWKATRTDPAAALRTE